ncbi:MAG: helix-turn-helix domain-containing protein, partial [Actinomycetota bacterium]|nr:helix-turn-helix domain-containing protein [Actinomycetota bacterium]
EPGLALAKRWRAQRDCPGWARRFSAETWSRPLAVYAAHGWTERDLTQALNDLTNMGIRIYDDPHRPIPYLLMLLRRSNIEERPTIRIDVQAAEDLAEARQRAAQAPQRRAQHQQDRNAAIAALNGRARAEVLAITAAAAQRAQRNRERDNERRLR